jgi:hypothetical protein
MAESYITRKAGGGLKIEEALKSFTVASGETITAGTFVDYTQNLALGSKVTHNDAVTSENEIANVGTDKVVIIFNDGSNSGFGTSIVGTVSGTSISFGSKTVFNNGYASSKVITSFGTDKVVVVYTDQENSNRATAIVGTVSGTSISWGSKNVFNSNVQADHFSITSFGTDKVVITYMDYTSNQYRGTAIVGTVSGTSISFGSKTQFTTNQFTQGMAITPVGTDKVVIAFTDTIQGVSSKGTAIVGTVSGTSISFGSKFEYETGNSQYNDIKTYGTDKIIIVYIQSSNSNLGTAIVGTVSGTSISFGSKTVFNNGNTRDTVLTVFGDKIAICYRNQSSSNHGTLRTATVSGTTFIFESPIVFNNAATKEPDITNIGIDTIVFVYMDDFSPDRAHTIVGAAPKLLFNATAEKVFGLAKTSGTAGQTVEVYTNT